ncbi:MAG: MBL fold metallo-hydrolase [Candidatus Verstraetearchaeota archaeon]|nr:MBL fold metallo-hydrolase [Candidatus Verstraetearchaeota archaeon]
MNCASNLSAAYFNLYITRAKNTLFSGGLHVIPNKLKILLSGVPGFSSRGFFGWCTIALVKVNSGEYLLFDTGHHGDRLTLLRELERMGLSPDKISHVVVSHLHFDHCLNMHLFKKAKIYASEKELNYVLSNEYEAKGDPFVPYAYVKDLSSRIATVEDGQELAPRCQVVLLPGHTPGSLGLFLEDVKVILVGDAIRHAWELLHEPGICFHSLQEAEKSAKKALEIAEVVVPGHDRPFKLEEGRVHYLEDFHLELIFRIHPHDQPVTVKLES